MEFIYLYIRRSLIHRQDFDLIEFVFDIRDDYAFVFAEGVVQSFNVMSKYFKSIFHHVEFIVIKDAT